MCRPEHFTVSYTINPWMEPANPTDTATAVRQWQDLYDTYVALGHEIELIDPIEGLPDMVYTANGGFLIDGIAYGPKFRFKERAGEAGPFIDWFRAAGFDTREPVEVNEGEGDFLLVGDVILAGTGFRSTGDSHREIGEVFGREVISLTLTDPRFYHLDTALAVLDPVQGVENGGPERANIAYLPVGVRRAQPGDPRRALPRRDPRLGRGRRRLRPQLGQRRLQRHHLPARRGLREAAARARLQPDHGRPVRAPARRRRHQVLHARAARGRIMTTPLIVDAAPRRSSHGRRAARRAQLPPAARRDRQGRGRLGHRRRGQALPRPARRVLRAELRARPPGDPRRRAGAARPPHPHEPGVPQRPARASSPRRWRSCAARTSSCR